MMVKYVCMCENDIDFKKREYFWGEAAKKNINSVPKTVNP